LALRELTIELDVNVGDVLKQMGRNIFCKLDGHFQPLSSLLSIDEDSARLASFNQRSYNKSSREKRGKQKGLEKVVHPNQRHHNQRGNKQTFLLGRRSTIVSHSQDWMLSLSNVPSVF
jgi:hypothetical protein